MTELVPILSQNGAPSWLIITVVLVLAVLSTKRAGEIPGKLGAWSRWITTRQERSLDREMTLRQKIDTAVVARVATAVAPVKEENATLSKELADIRKDLDAERRRHREETERMRIQYTHDLLAERRRHHEALEPITAERDLLASWSVYVARWWHDKERALAEMGVIIPPPPWPSFQSWLDELTQRQNQETQND